jgi:hypothetical protein
MCVIHQPCTSNTRMTAAPIQCRVFAGQPHRVVEFNVMQRPSAPGPDLESF